MTRTYEMLWDCGYCGQKKNLGRTHRHCPTCGAAQDEEARYFPSDAEKIAVEDHEFVGADKVCPACGSPGSAKAARCGGCGSALDGAAEATRRSDQGGVAFDGESLAEREQKEALEPKESAPQKPAAKKPAKKKKAGIIASIAAAMTGLFVMCGWTETVTMKVVGAEWVRSVQLEEFGPVQKGAWCDSVPSSGRVTGRSRKVRSTNKIPNGEDCTTVRRDNGDGTFSESESCTTRYREEDVYADFCDYVVDEWHAGRKVERKGGPSEEPTWPEVVLRKSGQCIGCEREGARSEALRVQLSGKAEDGDLHEEKCEVPRRHFDQMKVGTEWRVPVGSMTGIVMCSMIEGLPEL